MPTPLTPIQQRFCEEYVKHGGNGEAAYCVAADNPNKGTAKTAAHKLLRNPRIIAEIDRLKGIARETASRELKFTYNNCLEEVLEIARDRNQPASPRITAYKLAASMCGYLAPQKVEVERKPGVALTDEELLAIAQGTK